MGLDSVFTAELPFVFGHMQLVRLLEERPGRRLFLAETSGQGGLPPQVAVLVVRPPSQRSGRASMNDLLGDLQRARLLRHPGIAQTFACGVEDDVVFVVCELTAGPSLAQLVSESGKLPLQSAVAIIAQVGLALEHAHQQAYGGRPAPLLHRHLSPEWVTVGADGRVRLSGFGLGQLLDVYSPTDAGPTSALCFASPEVLAGQAVSPRSDLFALGAVLAYVTLGASPFDVPVGAQKAQYLSGIVRALADGGLAAKMDELVVGLGRISQRMVALDPSGRHGSVGEAVVELRALLEPSPEAGEQGMGPFDHDATLGHGGAPSVSALTIESEIAARRKKESPPAAAPSGRPEPPPVAVPQRPIVEPPPLVPSRGPLTLSVPVPAWANEVDTDNVPTDEAPQPVSPETQPGNEDGAPTDRMSSLFYRDQGVVPPAPSGSEPPHPIGPDSSAPPESEPQRPARPKPPPVPPSRRKKPSPWVPILALMVFLVFSVLAVLGALVYVNMKFGKAPDPMQEGAELPGDAPVLEPGPAVEFRDPSTVSDPGTIPGAGEQDAEPATAAEKSDPGADEFEDQDRPKSPPRAERPVRPAGSRKSRSAAGTGTAAELAITHRPPVKGDSGASDLISVRVIGPADTRVQVYSGPAGGPFKSFSLERRGVGRWEGWLSFDVPAGEVLEYWVVASHPQAESPAFSGSGSKPLRVKVR